MLKIITAKNGRRADGQTRAEERSRGRRSEQRSARQENAESKCINYTLHF